MANGARGKELGTPRDVGVETERVVATQSLWIWGNIDHLTLDRDQLDDMKQTWQRKCMSTLDHNIAYC